MVLIFPEVCNLKNIAPLFANFDNRYNSSEILIDYSEINFVDSSGANYLLAFPFFFKDIVKDVKIRIKPNNNVFSYFRNTGILRILENNFAVVELGEKENYSKVIGETVKSNKNPFFRTYCTNEMGFPEILKEISSRTNRYLNTKGLIIEVLTKNLNSSYENQIEFAVRNFSICILELMQNVFDHSDTSFGAITINYLKNPTPQLSISITDLGIGIKKSLLKSNLFNNTDYPDSYYIRQAVNKGVTSTNDIGRGLGLFSVSEAVSRLFINSGNGIFVKNNTTQIERFKEEVKDLEEVIKGTNINCFIEFTTANTLYE